MGRVKFRVSAENALAMSMHLRPAAAGAQLGAVQYVACKPRCCSAFPWPRPAPVLPSQLWLAGEAKTYSHMHPAPSHQQKHGLNTAGPHTPAWVRCPACWPPCTLPPAGMSGSSPPPTRRRCRRRRRAAAGQRAHSSPRGRMRPPLHAHHQGGGEGCLIQGSSADGSANRGLPGREGRGKRAHDKPHSCCRGACGAGMCASIRPLTHGPSRAASLGQCITSWKLRMRVVETNASKRAHGSHASCLNPNG